MIFEDRKDAGRQLADSMDHLKDGVIYALPRGGVVVGAEIAKALKIPLDVIVVKKVGHPYNPEFAIGAVSLDGGVVLGDSGREYVGQEWFQNIIAAKREEANTEKEKYASVREPIDPEGRVAIVVDDGVATGLTMLAAIRWLKNHKAKKVIVAVPVAPKDVFEKIKSESDEVIAIDVPEDFMGAVGSYYQNFSQVSSEEVEKILTEKYE